MITPRTAISSTSRIEFPIGWLVAAIAIIGLSILGGQCIYPTASIGERVYVLIHRSHSSVYYSAHRALRLRLLTACLQRRGRDCSSVFAAASAAHDVPIARIDAFVGSAWPTPLPTTDPASFSVIGDGLHL